MKKLPVLALLFAAPLMVRCQADTTHTTTLYPKLDTINYYLIDSESIAIQGGQVIHRVNNKLVTEEQWKRMTLGAGQIKNCTPCMVKTYNDGDTLLSIGMQYKKYHTGSYTAFYPGGAPKISGSYKLNPTGKWDKSTIAKYGNKKDGQWMYYSPAGKITAIELYQDGVLIKKTPVK